MRRVRNQRSVERLANLREFGEHGGVTIIIEASTTFTVMEAGTMPEIFQVDSVPMMGVASYTDDTSIRRSTCSVVNLPRWKALRRAIAPQVV